MSAPGDVIHVACQADRRLAPDCAVMLHSLLSRNPGEAFEIHFLHDCRIPVDLMDGWRGVVEGLGARWSPLQLPDAELEGFPPVAHYGGWACWYRLFLHRLLNGLPRILYLDADILITGRVRPLWETSLGECAVGAVTNSLFASMEARVRDSLGVPDAARYFNSGVLLLDLERLRRTGLGDRVIALVREGGTPLPWPDQDALNAVLWSHRKALHPRWNAMNALWELPDRYLAWSPQEMAEARADPVIVHFVGPYKPLHYRNRHPLRERFFEHLRSTPWRDQQIEGRTAYHALLRPLPTLWQWRIEAGVQGIRRLRGLVPGDESPIGSLLRDVARIVRPRRERSRLDHVLSAFGRQVKDVFFVQVGSNDAQHDDPLRAHALRGDWHGILVEPVPYLFERLRRNCAGRPGLILENAAITTHDGIADFYSVAESADPLPEWYDQIGSFSLDHVLKHEPWIPGLRDRVVKSQVPCLRFEALCQKHGVTRIDVLHVDTEGHDFEVLKQVDFEAHAPALVLYEHRHLDPGDRAACRAMLVARGYELLEIGADTLCGRRDVVTRRWSRVGRAWWAARRAFG